MRLVLVRHGETAWNKEGRFQGQSPVGLNQRGIWQARQTAKSIVLMKPTALYASPLPRSMMTAEEISRELGSPVQRVEGIREVSLGKLEGITGHEMRTKYPHIYNAWRRDPSRVVFPDGESLQQLQDRSWNALNGLEKAHARDVVVAVSHNFAIRSFLCRFLQIPLSSFHGLRVDLASITILQVNYRSRQVLTMNDRCHLSSEASEE